MSKSFTIASAAFAISLLVAGCGSDATGPTTAPAPVGPPPEGPANPTTPPNPTEPGCRETFDSTFEAIQTTIFERQGCTTEICHGSSAAGGLDLSPDVAYANLYGRPGQISDMPLVQPGRTNNSLLYLKLAAATLPDRFDVAGGTMPSGRAPLSEDDLELIRLWIYSGAPEDGVIESTIELIDACVPDPTPITIEPLPPPAVGEGVQFAMPPFDIPAATETEVCLASCYDFTDEVPDRYKDPTGTMFRYRGFDMRQDPQSHHLILYAPGVPTERAHDPAFGDWTCKSGERVGEPCEPTDPQSCGDDGLCGSEPHIGSCFGFGPDDFKTSVDPVDVQGIGGAQRAQLYTEFGKGVFAEIPLSGCVFWNSHAFNLTPVPHRMNARLNYLFADEQSHVSVPFPISFSSLYQAAGTPPFTEVEYCNSMTFEKGTRITEVTQHTHRFGRNFRAWLNDGTLFYENHVYNDPVVVRFEPPLAFDSEDPAERTIYFCADFNNGVNDDGSPNPETVTRRSRTPENQLRAGGACEPTACAEGNVGAPCAGAGDDAACNSSATANDGFCDACPIHQGISTENSMFLLLGRLYMDDE